MLIQIFTYLYINKNVGYLFNAIPDSYVIENW